MKMAYTSNEKAGIVRVQAIRMLASGSSTRKVARHFGYAQSTIVKWWKRRNEAWHQQSLPTRSSRPHRSPKRISQDIEAKIIATRYELKRCTEVVHQKLITDGISVSVATVKRVLSRYGLLAKRSPWKKKRKYPIRPDVAHEGDLVELDTIHFVNKYGIRSYVYTAIDVYSRYGFALLSEKATTHASIRFLKKAKKYFPFAIHCIQTDNGPEFGKWFTDHCGSLHRHNHPRSPNENGHLERFNRTIQEEMPKHKLCIFRAKDIAQFLAHYNHKRMHLGINFKTPKQMLILTRK